MKKETLKIDLLNGNINKGLLLFALPMILGNLLQQLYNIADTVIVGKFVGADSLAAVGSAYSLMTFITSVIIGLCMGSGSVFSYYMGRRENQKLKECTQTAFALIGVISVFIWIIVQIFINPILRILQVPNEIYDLMYQYTSIVFLGIIFIFLYNYCAFALRAVGNSVVPLYFLGATSVLNIGLDLIFVLIFKWELRGAAIATVISQAISGIGLCIYTWIKESQFRFSIKGFLSGNKPYKEILNLSITSSVQQSVMNFGILMVQGLVNSFGTDVMTAFAAGVKVDTFAYMPAQEFGNAYSIYVSQNYGAGQNDRIKKGTKTAMRTSAIFCSIISIIVCVCANQLMKVFVNAEEGMIIKIGVTYLRIEGIFYVLIGILFLLYGYFRGINKPSVSLLLTIISLGTRVILAYILSSIPFINVNGIWCSIPIGWFLADLIGICIIKRLAINKNQ